MVFFLRLMTTKPKGIFEPAILDPRLSGSWNTSISGIRNSFPYKMKNTFLKRRARKVIVSARVLSY